MDCLFNDIGEAVTSIRAGYLDADEKRMSITDLY